MKMQKCYSHIIAIKSIEYYNYLIIKHLYQYMQCLEVLPINYQSNYSVCYHSDYQFDSSTFVDSLTDYFLGQLCPIFCVCKSTSYDAKCLKTSNLREFPRPPNMNIYNSISAHITAYSNTECITSKPKMYYLSSVYKDADKVFVLKINNLQDVLPQINR